MLLLLLGKPFFKVTTVKQRAWGLCTKKSQNVVDLFPNLWANNIVFNLDTYMAIGHHQTNCDDWTRGASSTWEGFDYGTAAPDVSVLRLPTSLQGPLTSVATQILLTVWVHSFWTTPAKEQLGPACSRSRPLAFPQSSGFKKVPGWELLCVQCLAWSPTHTKSQSHTRQWAQANSPFQILEEGWLLHIVPHPPGI